MTDSTNKGWYHNRYLPHFDTGEVPQFVTFRLFGTLPQSKLAALQEEWDRKETKNPERERIKKIEEWLDRGEGDCWLRDHSVAQIVQETLIHFHLQQYRLHAWVIMPNHVHVLFTPIGSHRLFDIVQGWKSCSARKANSVLRRKGSFWQDEYFDRFIRNERHYGQAVSYIEENPVKAGLCSSKSEWPFGSAYAMKEESITKPHPHQTT